MQIAVPAPRLKEFATAARRIPPPLWGGRAVLVQSDGNAATLTAGHEDTAVRMSAPCQGGPCSFPVGLDDVDKASKSDGALSPLPEGVFGHQKEALSKVKFGGKGDAAVDWPKLRRVLGNAFATVAPAKMRYALQNVCLHSSGAVASDGRQLYSGNSVSLPVPKGQEILVPPAKTLLGKAFKDFSEAEFSQDAEAVFLQFAGAWEVRLKKQQGPFPDWAKAVPAAGGAAAKFVLSDEEAKRLLQLLPKGKAPAGSDAGTARLEVGKAVRVFFGEGAKGVALEASCTVHKPMKVSFNPEYFRTALGMGFRSFRLHGAESPVVAEDDGEIYLWMPYAEDAACRRKPDTEQTAKPEPAEPKETRKESETVAANNGAPNGNGNGAEPMDFDEVLAEMTDIRDGIKDLSRRASSACAALRSHGMHMRKREKAVHQTLAGLKQLQDI